MSCGKCGKGCMSLCPFSFGLAVGIVSFLVVFIGSMWMMGHGVPPEMVGHMVEPSKMDGLIHAVYALIKGFLFGFFVALFYDLIRCCCRRCCWKKSDTSCGCGPEDKPVQ